MSPVGDLMPPVAAAPHDRVRIEGGGLTVPTIEEVGGGDVVDGTGGAAWRRSGGRRTEDGVEDSVARGVRTGQLGRALLHGPSYMDTCFIENIGRGFDLAHPTGLPSAATSN
jgi:hypothetical protein